MLSTFFLVARVAGVVLVAAVLTALPPAAGPAHASHLKATPVASGLAFPAGFTFAPDGRIFYGERFSGKIRIYDPGVTTGLGRRFFTVSNLVTSGEQGLLGIALHPNYPASPYVYASAIRLVNGVGRNQIVRITDNGGTGSAMKVIFDGGASTNTHVGGRILFGPDRKLYLVVGDKQDRSRAQKINNRAGKVLRMTPGGAVPPDNPFSNLVYAYGLRNSFGLTFDPLTDGPWETDNGPECNDEVNQIIQGANYGWGPSATCSTPPSPPANTNQNGPTPVMPQLFYTPPPALTGLVFCGGCGLGTASEGHLFFGAWNNGTIREVALNSTRTGVASDATIVYDHPSNVLSMEEGPTGAIYFSDPDEILKLELA
jgi:glucose/arabinose dehydrogenase